MAATNNTAQPLAANTALVFAEHPTLTGTSISHTPNSGTFTLSDNGFYQIEYNVVATNTSSTVLPALVSVHLEKGNTAIPGTTMSATVAAANSTVPLSASTIINVTDAPANIELVTGNGNGRFSNMGITIRKLD